MSSKIIAIIIAIIFIGLGAYFVTRPIGEKTTKPKIESEKKKKNDSEESKNNNTITNGDDDVFNDFLKWKKNENPTLQEIDNHLDELSEKIPTDYRFPLERIRGAAKIKGVHSHNKAFELLADAAQTAIECDCGDTEKMLKDLQMYSRDKSNGFWKLATHPKHWNLILKALENENIEELEITEGHH